MDKQSTLLYGSQPAAPPVDNPTLAAPSDATLAATTGVLGGSLTSTGGIGKTLIPANRYSTVLPEVHAQGDGVELRVRDQARYESQRVLGRGGMGEVKLAEDHDIGRKVAIKRMLDAAEAHTVARFIDEVRTVGKLEHPNIVPIHDVGVDPDGALFFVMKFVDGETLSSIIERLVSGDPTAHRHYTYERRLDLFASLCHALQYAHSQGLVHRDVKPENVMVGPYGEVVLMDWGIAHRVRADGQSSEAGPVSTEAIRDRAGAQTVEGSVIGTPQYMSPEQARGEVAALDGRSDLYSAFVLLFELLTLRPYIAAGQPAMQTVCAVLECSPPGPYDPVYEHPQQKAPVPAELRHFLQRGLAPQRDQRFADAKQVLDTLDAIRGGAFAVQCPVTLLKQGNTRMERFMDRWPRASLALATFGAATMVAGLSTWVRLIVG